MEKDIEKIPHLRLCITEECDNKCFYCRPGGEACRFLGGKEMSLHQIYQLVNILARHGITHLKITGGEPLIRDDIPKMILSLRSINGIKDIHLVTRAPKAGSIADQLKEVGLSCLNFSLDSLNPYTFLRITRSGRLDLLLQAIKRAYKSNLELKFNMVVIRGINDHEIPAMIEFVGQYGATLKLLDLMNMPGDPKFLDYYYMPLDRIVEKLKTEAVHWSTERQSGGLGSPMSKFEMPSGATVLVKDARIGTWYGDTCKGCKNFPCQDAIMALRLTVDGCLQQCLLRQDNLVDLLKMVEDIESEETIDKAVDLVLCTFREAVYYEAAWKP